MTFFLVAIKFKILLITILSAVPCPSFNIPTCTGKPATCTCTCYDDKILVSQVCFGHKNCLSIMSTISFSISHIFFLVILSTSLLKDVAKLDLAGKNVR